jgi:hypothetical protein
MANEGPLVSPVKKKGVEGKGTLCHRCGFATTLAGCTELPLLASVDKAGRSLGLARQPSVGP